MSVNYERGTMKHLGDITKINGAAVEPVEVIIGGSPCQDLSVAGKREGLSGERSGLFMEQIRIIKEMRSADEQNGAAYIRPRYMVWENVPGAFSSNKGEDFRIVLEETARVCDPTAVIPRPEKGKWTNAGAIMGDGWSIAWRVHDAQFWGVPQRRRRIALVADFGGQSAPEILFERKGVFGDITQSATPWKDFADAIAKRFGTANRAERGTEHLTYCIQGNSIDRADTAGCNGKGVKEGVSYTLNTIDRPAVYDARGNGEGKIAPTVTAKYGTDGGNTPLVYDARGNGNGDTTPTITGDHENRVTDYTALAVGFPLGFRPENVRAYNETATTLCNGTRPGSCNGVITIDRAAFNQGENAQYDFKVDDEGVNSTVVSKGPSAVCSQSNVRRLTPLECERLQGFPDGWTDIGDYTDTNSKKRKTSDSARYKALGNSIALPSWAWLLERLNRYCRYHTMASLFDGIGGFPLIWETLNGSSSCIWASEIEEFPIAVTKYHFGYEREHYG